MTESTGHAPVLLSEVVDGLAIQPSGIYIDGTFGRGGHSLAILARLGGQGRLLALDQDPSAVEVGQRLATEDARFEMEHSSFDMIGDLAEKHNLVGRVNGVLLDLGVSSPQLDDPVRGFSFLRDGPLDMRMNPAVGRTAADWLASAKETDIARVLKEYGEERFARRIARAIVNERASTPLTKTLQLAEIIRRANPKWEREKHPATRSFQAIRIYINRELDALQGCLEHVHRILAVSGRLVVISFHSLEDRMVKRFMRDKSRTDQLPSRLPIPASMLQAEMRLVGKAQRPGTAELKSNPRARSAVLRIAEKLA